LSSPTRMAPGIAPATPERLIALTIVSLAGSAKMSPRTGSVSGMPSLLSSRGSQTPSPLKSTYLFWPTKAIPGLKDQTPSVGPRLVVGVLRRQCVGSGGHHDNRSGVCRVVHGCIEFFEIGHV